MTIFAAIVMAGLDPAIALEGSEKMRGSSPRMTIFGTAWA